MKRLLSFILVMSIIVISVYATGADSTVFTATDAALQEIVEEYMTDWFGKNLSEHYALSDERYAFYSLENRAGHVEGYGCFEAIHELKYANLDELPYITGLKQAVGINNAEAFAAGDMLETMSMTIASRIGEDLLTPTQADYVASQLMIQLNEIKESMVPAVGAYYFHIEADCDDAELSNVLITLEVDGVGYVDPSEVFPGDATELYADGLEETTAFVQSVKDMPEDQLTALKAIPLAGPVKDYDQIAARDYALEYSANMTESCNCGALDIKNGDGVTYSAWNTTVYPYDTHLCHTDCADFVSQSMSAGGLPEGGTWFRTKNKTGACWGGAWASCRQLKTYMLDNDYWYQSTFAQATAGHVCFTSDTHVVMITLNDTVTHRYSAHTNDRHNVVFQDKSGYEYYRINMG